MSGGVSAVALQPGTTRSHGAASSYKHAVSPLHAGVMVKLKLESSCLFKHVQDSCVPKCYKRAGVSRMQQVR